MKNFPTEQLRTENMECEFVPPLDLPETWGLAWERQLNAVLAWQAANADSGAEAAPVTTNATASAEAATFRQVGGTACAPTMRTITRLTVLLDSLRERTVQIQSEAANIAIAEVSRSRAPTSPVEGNDQALRPLDAENARRITELIRSWFEMTAAAQAEMGVLAGFGATGARNDATGPVVFERRTQARVIDFPDRRRAA
ncbi:hypothetical protein [Aromatoleum aromaticum]|uniref:hypothetical protein n=1 Tax=Aromatoleum aromaticum TaxID=551760 RepID=UPI0002FA05A0|nr:hypothetical protein [Aromatoleum aromaticum]NMG54124.1 hypothetical protein [Aromatoleum aromaticum]